MVKITIEIDDEKPKQKVCPNHCDHGWLKQYSGWRYRCAHPQCPYRGKGSMF